MNPVGLERYGSRETSACGPGLVLTRLRAFSEAQRQDEVKLICGAAEDAAAALIAYSQRLRSEYHIPPKP